MDIIIKLIKNVKISKLFVITFLVTEELAQKLRMAKHLLVITNVP